MASDEPEAKWDAYHDTVLEFCDAPSVRVDLRRALDDEVREAVAAQGIGGSFAVLTAENPGGENAEDAPTAWVAEAMEERNARRTSRLREDLDRRGIVYRRVDGMAPDGDYRERCLAIAATRAEAVALARRFDQLALFWYDGRDFWLLPAEANAEPERLPRAPAAPAAPRRAEGGRRD